MSGKKGMKKYPLGIREEVVSRIRAGESQRALSREYEISRRAIQCWLKEPFFPKTRGRKPAEAPAEYKYENLLNREFHAERPNSKWVTDISYIHTKQGVLYLSIIRDLHDSSIVASKTGTKQTVNLVLDTIRLAMR